MKLLPMFASCVLLTSAALAAETPFPGLKAVLTEEEWKRAGLDRLSVDQLGVVDAALIGHYKRALTDAKNQGAAAAVAANPGAPNAPAKSLWERFGLGGIDAPDWRTQPPLVSKVVGWQSPSRFLLENGQVWEGVERIPFELVDKEVIIEARPLGAFALKLHERSAIVRVRRVK